MKITAIICGRPNGETSQMARVALKAAKEAGADEVQLINLMQMNIKPCIDCKNCVKRLSDPNFSDPCPLKDDMDWLDQQYLDSDAVIYAAPVYENAVPGPFKTYCDRLGPSHDITFQKFSYDNQKARGLEPNTDPRFFIPRPAIFIGQGGSEWNYLSYPTLAIPCIPLGLQPVAFVSIPWNAGWQVDGRAEEIKKAAAHLVEMAKLPAEERYHIGDPGMCPVCHNRVMVLNDNADELTCALCGAIGTVEVKDGKVSAKFSPDAQALSHILEGGRMQHAKDLQQVAARFASLDMPAIMKAAKEMAEEIPYSRP